MQPFGPLAGFLGQFLLFINAVLVPVIFGLAFITFLWYVYVYFIQKADDKDANKKGKTFLMYSFIGFVVMLSLWGIVNLLTSSLMLDNRNQPTPVFIPPGGF